ncbi:hypothetical protein [Thalassomonas haliotis]|uniref:Uncharacterized protein n=1 Tax=Thalassomonas haliotis TaxID=485448 RepID=A0ABY7VJM0_9GAMM|nr:hypothetical protein [Thalassomonas haliotis]WDE13133.1 hypothetical protein H3N35_06730 [Thalassomonas haliotis]
MHQIVAITLQQASGWTYGDNFFFIDHLNDPNENGFEDNALYGEFYLNPSPGGYSSISLPWGRAESQYVGGRQNKPGEGCTGESALKAWRLWFLFFFQWLTFGLSYLM